MTISIIVAIGERNRVIGIDGRMPWDKEHLRPDMARFMRLTKGHPLVMGRVTWESIDEKNRPLRGRTNIVVTRDQTAEFPGAYPAHSLCAALQRAEHFEGCEEIFVMGGQHIYELALPRVDRLYLTLVDDDAQGNRWFPEYPEFTKVIDREVALGSNPRLTFLTLERE